MNVDEIRKKLAFELNNELSKNDLGTPTFNPYEKPKMFMASGVATDIKSQDFAVPVKGIAFGDSAIVKDTKPITTLPIYNMQELIKSNPDCMATIQYDKKILKNQLALVKRREWEDILFEDVNLTLFKKIFNFYK